MDLHFKRKESHCKFVDLQRRRAHLAVKARFPLGSMKRIVAYMFGFPAILKFIVSTISTSYPTYDAYNACKSQLLARPLGNNFILSYLHTGREMKASDVK